MLQICYYNADRTTLFAAGELKKYITLMGNNNTKLKSCDNSKCSCENSIKLGTFAELDLDLKSEEETCSPFDDHIIINIKNGTGYIAGSNIRSLLLGVYSFLTEAGLRWVRPGSDGEIIVKKQIDKISVNIDQKPSYRHRGICIEGANSVENIVDLIDWMPKVGMNSYFIQFREGFTFFDRWYSHRNNENLDKTSFSLADARNFKTTIEDEISKRGLIYHAVGHGWTCEPFGVSGTGWDPVDNNSIPEDAYQYFAKIDGKRDLWKGVPLDTNLCYSNTKVQEIIAKNITEYLQEHSNVDLLHFWLADGSNNHCECEDCKDTRPSDYYVSMLNLIDEYLTKNNIDTKIVFLIYVDLLWPPQKEKLNNPDRFIMMFAPITRTYSSSFATDKDLPELPEYTRNELEMPKSVEENISFLESWQKSFEGDSFDFDYHMIWDHYLDPGYYFNSKILYEDIKNLKKIGLNGFNSCQVQRSFFPTGLPMYVMGKTLWDTNLEFDDIVDEYFKASFGEYADKVKEYMKTLSDLFDPVYLRREKELLSEDSLNKFKQIPDKIEGFKPVIDKGILSESLPVSTSFKHLKIHADGALILADCLKNSASGNYEKAKELFEDYLNYYRENELLIQNVFDVYEFCTTLKRKKYWE